MRFAMIDSVMERNVPWTLSDSWVWCSRSAGDSWFLCSRLAHVD
jgi:hypothetical protein